MSRSKKNRNLSNSEDIWEASHNKAIMSLNKTPKIQMKEREELINGLSVQTQKLLLELYGSLENFLKSNPHSFEEYILRFDKYCGYEDQVISIAKELDISLVSNEPAVELYQYFDFLCKNPSEIKEFLENGNK